ncbi:WD40-repeat-containing domain protein, partial [Bombardia bombarda]
IKRKRDNAPTSDGAVAEKTNAAKKTKTPNQKPTPTAPARAAPFKVGSDSKVTIQIVAGSYDRVLHGVTATIRDDSTPTADFADTFLFNAHTSAIRCLALSPPSAPLPGQTQKVILASGSTDERINLYNLSAHPPSARTVDDQKALSSLTPRPVLENPKNRELGTLLHHNSNITRLSFPNRSKLLSASEDSTVAVTRTRDWALLHTFKCPIPKVQGRPSGDTAGLGGAPSGVNDFAVHPSNKIMISVGKGERCMRLWNLETGKKSRVLNFARDALVEIGEGRHSTGEARRIVWGSARGEDEFAVGFDRDVLVFGMDCLPRCRLMRDVAVKSKVHEFGYVRVDDETDETVLAVSTEDGRVLFFSTDKENTKAPPAKEVVEEAVAGEGGRRARHSSPGLPCATLVSQLGGKEMGVQGRIKDFSILAVEDAEGKRSWYVVTAGSDGRLRVWRVEADDLRKSGEVEGRQVGKLLGTYETQNRITCLEAFIMIPRPDGAEESEYEFDEDESSGDEESE